MPFLRFWRDKRGYEHTYLIHASNKKGAAARILYWYRTPPGVKVGRVAFDEDVRKALEAQYPSIVFDWSRLTDAAPPPDVEHWRERRRQEKAARQARQAAERDDADDEPPDADGDADETELSGTSVAGSVEAAVPGEADMAVADAAAVGPAPPEAPGAAVARPQKRRRRGGRRRRRGAQGDAAGGEAIAAGAADAGDSVNAGGGGAADDNEAPDGSDDPDGPDGPDGNDEGAGAAETESGPAASDSQK